MKQNKAVIIELEKAYFEKMVNELKQCEKDKEKLKQANKYLNEEIKKYNKNFTNENNK